MDTSVRILKVFLNRWLDKAETDTNRTLRKLVEFGYYFSSSVPQRKFFAEAKKIMSDNSCKYYDLAQNLFSYVNKDRATELGIDFGYYGLAKNCRFSNEHHSSKDKAGLVVGFLPDCAQQDDSNELSSQFYRIAQSGANIYFIFCDELQINDNELSEIIDKNPHKAFFLFTSDESFSMKFAQKNVMPVLNLNSQIYLSASEKLKKRGRLFGGYYTYGDDTADTVTYSSFLDNVYERNCLFLFLAANKNCSQNVRDKVSGFCSRQKRKPTHPIFITDILGDINWLNKPLIKKPNI